MLASNVLVFLTCLIGTCTHLGSAVISNETQLFNSLLQDYDKDASPAQFAGKPTEVTISLYIFLIDISKENSDMTFTCYLRMGWDDPRLKHSSANKPADKIQLPDDSWTKIWIPDIFIRDAISTKYHDMATPNRLLRLGSSGSLWSSTKVTVVVACDSRNFRRYPFETLVCILYFESYGHRTDSLTISAHEKDANIMFSHDLAIRGFSLTGAEYSGCTQNYTTGSYTCLKLSVSFKRRDSAFVSRVCIPSILLVIISWISFWIDRESTIARLMIGFLSLIAMTLVFTHSQKSPEFASYTTLFDAWLLVSFIFIFASILEYFLIVILSRKRFCAVPSAELGTDVKGSKDADNGKRASEWIDWISRIVFPAAFSIFIIVFFCL